MASPAWTFERPAHRLGELLSAARNRCCRSLARARAHLPENRTAAVEVWSEKPREDELACEMNMCKGKLIVEE